MRLCAWFMVPALLIPSSATMAQEVDRPDKKWPWHRWLPGAGKNPIFETSIHPRARWIADNDRQRETARENFASQQRISAWKAQSMREMRIDRERRIASAVAKAWTPPFDPPPRPSSIPAPLLAAATQENKEDATQVVGMTPVNPAPQPTPAARATATPRPGSVAAAVDRAVQQVGDQIIGSKPGQPLSPGLFALILTGLFLVPAAGVTFIMFGIAHLRGHSFVSGSVILLLGGGLLWGTWILARTINPDILSGKRAQGAIAESDELRPMQALQSDLFWNSEQ